MAAHFKRLMDARLGRVVHVEDRRGPAASS
jgi:hypothetical protein